MSKLISDNKLLTIINDIIKTASTTEMQNLNKFKNVEYRKILTDKYPDFSMDYPALFNKLIDDPTNFEINRLMQMLAQRKKVQNNNMSYEEASSQIGQQYYDEFAKPLIDKIPKNK